MNRTLIQAMLEAAIKAYQRVAPDRLRKACRYEPTCSEYALRAIQKYGARVGVARSFRRVMSCREPNGGMNEP